MSMPETDRPAQSEDRQLARKSAETTACIFGSDRNRCPICNALVDPWKIDNSIRRHRCSDCNARLWMECSTPISVVCMSLPLMLIGIWYLVFPWSTIVFGCSLIGIGIPVVNIFVRILFGHPVANRSNLFAKLDPSIDQREKSTNNPMDRSGGSAAS